MSKTYDENVRKARALAQGIENNIDAVKNLGITTDQIKSMLEVANNTAEKSAEVDELRKIVAEKSSIAHLSLEQLNAQVKNLKKIIKDNFSQPEWSKFGIEDKR